jgi:hypothetical protein
VPFLRFPPINSPSEALFTKSPLKKEDKSAMIVLFEKKKRKRAGEHRPRRYRTE